MIAVAVANGSCGGKAEVPGSSGGGSTSTSSTGGSGATTATGTGVGGGQGGCSSDADCAYGAEWCVGGACVPCDNSGQVCDIACNWDWQPYERNGCYPCECAPVNQCTSDADCGDDECYAGRFCWDWCPAGEPSCCQGNICSGPGCDRAEGAQGGCILLGCPQGQTCMEAGCASSGCYCGGGLWGCDDDCGGGECF